MTEIIESLAKSEIFETLKNVTETFGGWVAFPLIFILLGTGIFVTFSLGWIQLRKLKHSFDVVSGRYDNPEDEGDVTHFQALFPRHEHSCACDPCRGAKGRDDKLGIVHHHLIVHDLVFLDLPVLFLEHPVMGLQFSVLQVQGLEIPHGPVLRSVQGPGLPGFRRHLVGLKLSVSLEERYLSKYKYWQP